MQPYTKEQILRSRLQVLLLAGFSWIEAMRIVYGKHDERK